MRILVTGASGLVGKLAVELAKPRHEVVRLSRAELDVTDPAAVRTALQEYSPHVVLHCAAYTDVDGAERDPERAMEVNARAAQHVADSARDSGARLVYVSTDYVFDGTKRSPYLEDDETRPLSVYGKTKLEGERRVLAACPDDHVIVRTGWLYGQGKGFVDWARARLVAGQELPLVDDQTGSPTSARDLAEALLELGVGSHRGVFHFVNPGETSWLGLGRAVAEELGHHSATLKPIAVASLNRPAPRPAYSVLSVERYERTTGAHARPWRDALRRYLQAG